MKRVIITLFLFLVASSFFIFTTRSQEYDPDFVKGKIISDFQMSDYNSMTLSMIQSFLQSKNSYLSTYISPDYQGIPKTAAEIIYDAAQRYQINPKYILVTLQKEQGLIQMQSPTQKRLDWAAGYAVCDSCSMDDPKIQKYKGFGKQVDNTAGAMRFYYDKNSIYEFIKRAGQLYNIDGEQVIFQNQATANLYTYTPHFHGNYTFWLIWQRYFGNPLAETRDSNASIYTGYMTQLVNSEDKNIIVKEGEKAYFWAEYLNIGTEAWHNEDLKNLYIIDSSYKSSIPMISQNSTFTATSSILNSIKVYSQKTVVNPGEVLRITIPIDSTNLKTESFNYMLVLGNKGWFADSDASFKVTRQFKYDAELSSGLSNNIDAFKKNSFVVKYKNVGTMKWTKTDTKLQMIQNGKTSFLSMNEASVAPGKIATFSFSETVNKVGGKDYAFSLYRIISTKKKEKFISGDYQTTVNFTAKYAVEFVSANVPAKMKPLEEKTISMTFKNVGKENLDKTFVLRSYSNVSSFAKSSFYSSTWNSALAIDKLKTTISPGESFTFTFKIKAPQTIATYNQYFQLERGTKCEEIIIDGGKYKLYKIKVTTK